MSRLCRIPFLLVLVAAAAATAATAATALTPNGASASSSRNYIDNKIIEALENLRSQMPEGWPAQGVPPLDPMDVGHINLNISNGGTRVQGSLTEVKVNGLSTFNIDLVHSNLLFLKMDIGLGIPVLDIAGNYSITGSAGVLPIYGEGPFKMDAFNATLSATVDLGETDQGYFGVAVLELDVACTTVDIHFENIMGGGDMDEFVNGVLSSLAPDILQSLEDQYMPWLEEALKHEINLILHGNTTETRDASVNDYFDRVFANMRQSIQDSGQDPLALPGDSNNFTLTLFNQSVGGGVEAGPGVVSGLSTVHRAGEMALLYLGEQDEAVWRGEVGLIDLQVDYRFGLTLPLFGKDLGFTAKMSFILLSFETDVFLHQSEITFAYCNVTEMGPVHFKEKGAGPLDTSLYNLLANTVLGELQGVVATAVEGVVCSLLEGAFVSG